MDELLEYIYKIPEEWTHIREIARKLEVSPTSIRKWAEELLKKNMIEKRQVGNLIQFRGAINSDEFVQAKRVFNLKMIYDTGLYEELSKNNSLITLFGSYSRGEDISNSDIDIAVSDSAQIELGKYEELLSRNIQLVKIDERISKELLTNIYNGITLKGVISL